jgi:class I fructose-bisphosphate aldolase
MATELKRSDSMDRIAELLGPNASTLLDHTSQTISKDHVQLPGPDFVDRVWGISDRPAGVLRSLQTLFDNGRLRGTGYLSILPVDQGIEHSAGASFAPNPQYFDSRRLKNGES